MKKVISNTVNVSLIIIVVYCLATSGSHYVNTSNNPFMPSFMATEYNWTKFAIAVIALLLLGVKRLLDSVRK